ncbi:MAG: hypothetical protein MJA31_09370 [Clostridia bacterium]|nr:hypothetical protein [Clostridia bacterium]
MVKKVQETTFDKFFSNRESLIYQFKKGDISKKEFIEEHYAFIIRLNLKPFIYRIDSFEKGLYNYQYYNVKAKYSSMKSKDKKIIEKHPDMVRKYTDDMRYFYKKKDETILKLLRYLDYYNVEAYFIKAKSSVLNGRLFEIVLKDYDNTVLHSINPGVLNELREEGAFLEEIKKSIIDRYVNERY